MKTKTMKTIQLWMLALVLTISSSTALTSCSKEDIVVPQTEQQPVILKGEAAVAWTRDHLDSLVNVYLASCGNLLDPDMTRDLLSCIGYTRLNVFDYREAGWLIDSVVLVRLMDRATKSVYRVEPIDAYKNEQNNPFFDIANYAQLLAKETDDAELKAISATLDNAFKEAIIHYRDVNNSKEHLDHYTLSVCLLREFFYTYDFKTKQPQLKVLNNYNEGYEKCDFHKLTGWGQLAQYQPTSTRQQPAERRWRQVGVTK